MKDVLATIESIAPLGGPYFRMHLKVGWKDFVPGQFVMVKTPGEAVFLRRPFGIVALQGGVMEMCFKVVGKGTAALSQVKPKEAVSVLGPLGKGFAASAEMKTAVLVAGGYGVAPLFGLAQLFKNEGRPVVFYYGAKTKGDLLYVTELTASGVDLKLATEDGSTGQKGLVTEMLEKEITKLEMPALFGSGPHGLLKEVAKIAGEKNIPAQVSLDQYMACGIGVCLGCVVSSRDGSYVRVCREGPVFNAEDIIWE